MFPMLYDVLSTLSRSLNDAQRNLHHHDVTDDALTLKRPSPSPDELQHASFIMNSTAGIVVVAIVCCGETARLSVSLRNVLRTKRYQRLASEKD